MFASSFSWNCFSKSDLGVPVTIQTQILDSPFGKMYFASIDGEICYGTFVDDRLISQLNEVIGKIWYNSTILLASSGLFTLKDRFFETHDAVLRVYGTPFQHSVWKGLAAIRPGEKVTYQQLANMLAKPAAVRAVASAIAANRIAYLIPCHRVVRSDGGLGGFRWGMDRKKRIINWEKNTRVNKYAGNNASKFVNREHNVF